MERPARMTMIAIVVGLGAVIASCGGQYTPPPDEGKTDEDLPYKRLVLSLELLPPSDAAEMDAGSMVDLWLVETDETGSTKRVDLGDLPGPCTVRRNPPGVAMKPLFALECTGGEGMRARVVHQRDQLIVLRAPGVNGDEFDFEESQRINLPIGVRILTE